MKNRRTEVADVLREHFESYRRSRPTSAQERRVAHDLVACRTASLGGHRLECTKCGHQETSYNSCRNRHCPKCQASGAADWLDHRCRDLLPVPYFHVVFTMPEELAPLALQNKAEVYGLLIRTAAQTLTTIAADERHLGARIGVTCVLHTWGQTLRHHPHVHCVVPGGGISFDENRWVASRPKFFLPVRVLSRLFRRRLLERLCELRERGGLEFHGFLQSLAEPKPWSEFLQGLRAKEWVVYSKPPFAGPEQVLKYLARYTHRVAITNGRIRSVAGGDVVFDWKDYSKGKASRTMRLGAVEFIRRFLLHVLPKGFQRIRHYGFLANRVRVEAIEKIRGLMPEASAGRSLCAEQEQPAAQAASERICPECGEGVLEIIAEIDPSPTRRAGTLPQSIPP